MPRFVGEEPSIWDDLDGVHPRHRLRAERRQWQTLREHERRLEELAQLVDGETPEDAEARETFERALGEPVPIPMPLATIGNQLRFAKPAAVSEEQPNPPPIPEPPREYVATVAVTEMEVLTYDRAGHDMEETALAAVHEALGENPPKVAAMDNNVTLDRTYEPIKRIGWHMDCRSTSATCTCGVLMTDLVWTNWNTTRVTSATTGAVWDNDPWRTWATAATTSSTATNTAIMRYIWKTWTEDGVRKTELRLAQEERYRPTPRTPEQIAEDQARERERRERAEIERKARVAEIAAAKERAEKLLMSALSPEQKQELKVKNYFSCRSQKGVLYRIYRGSHGNVKRVEGGREVESLCIQPANVPDGDAMLAQKLHIEYNEDDFRKTANISRLVN